MASTDLLYPQDFSLDSCKIVTALGQPYEFRFMLLHLEYFEDLYNNFITGSLTINDSVGFLSQLSFSGHDYLILGFSKPGTDIKLEKTFRAYKVSNRHIVNYQNETYTIHFCSEEAILSEQYKVSKSYPNTKISDIVNDIMYNQLGTSNTKFLSTNSEVTVGVRDIVIPNMKPFEAINWLCTQAISGTTKTTGTSYLFYENVNGYNFKSLQTLFKSPVYGVYKYEPKNLNMPDDARVQDLSLEANNVIGFEVVSNYDSLDMINSGAYANQLIAIDLLSLNYTVNNFDYLKYFNQAQKLNPYPILANYYNRFSQTANTTYQAVIKTAVTNTGDSTYNSYIRTKQPSIKDVNIETTIPFRTAQIPEINAIKYKISIPGDPYMTVGNIITFNLPELTRTTDDKALDNFYSGNYLVTAVKHTIDIEGKFMTLMEISKESVPNQYISPDNSLQAWKLIRGR
jgi:hypothetical protein